MTKLGLAIALAMLVGGFGWTAQAQEPMLKTQVPSPSTKVVGTWQMGESGGLQTYTFHSNGTYTYAGALATRGPGGDEIRATKDEDGVYQISGDRLTIARQRGTFSTRSTSRALEPETRVYRWSAGNTQLGPALQLVWPSGEAEVFYKR